MKFLRKRKKEKVNEIKEKDSGELSQVMIIIAGLAIAAVVVIGAIASVMLNKGEESARCISEFSTFNSDANKNDCSTAGSDSGGTLPPGGNENATPGEPIEKDETQNTLEECFEVTDGVITKYLIQESPITCGKDVIVPKEINGEEIHTIGKGAFYKYADDSALDEYRINSVKLPDTITSIKEAAFRANYLTDIQLPPKVEEIDYYAFRDNDITGELELPNSVRTIGISAFAGNNISGELNLHDSITEIEKYAFQDNDITSVSNFPTTIDIVKEGVFTANNNLSYVKLHDNVKTIERSAFSYTNLVNELTLPVSIEYIGYRSFYYSGAQPDLSELNNLAYIGNNAFGFGSEIRGEKKESDYKIVIPENVNYLGDFAFQYNNAHSIEVNSSQLKIILGRTFFNTKVHSGKIVFSENSTVEEIREGAFLDTIVGSDNNHSIKLPKTLKRLDTEAFVDSPISQFHIPQKTNVHGNALPENATVTRY